ncbi:13781_t:CDS:2 [Gigaspora rosea]|nr:13781_t:CDS:2 [Gigaspora rosea]
MTLTVISNVNKQMGAYVETTTSRFTKRLLECAKENPIPPKRVAKEMVDETNKNKENKETKWSLINFLNYRRKQADFSYDKTVERSEYKIALELLSVHDVCAKQCLENFDVKCTILFVICD